jgi:hypothetical protein
MGETAASQFRADWHGCLEILERRLLEADPDSFQRIIRTELNTWFQPEHHRGAWLRALSNVRPEAAAAVRQGLTEIRVPNREFEPARAYWARLPAYATASAAAGICFREVLLPEANPTALILLVPIFLLAVTIIVWRKERRRRRLQAAAAVRKGLEHEGARLAAILAED